MMMVVMVMMGVMMVMVMMMVVMVMVMMICCTNLFLHMIILDLIYNYVL